MVFAYSSFIERIELENQAVKFYGLKSAPTNRNDLFLLAVFTGLRRVGQQTKRSPGKTSKMCINKEITLLGDIDIDYLCNMKFGKHPFIETLHNLNLFQLVKVITRPLSKACLDHIWSSHPERRINVQVFPSGLSDHLPTIATRKNKPAVQSTVVLQQSPTVTSTTRIKNSLLLL